MTCVCVRNQTRDSLLASEALWARTYWTRLRGLLARPAPQEGQGLILDPCKSVHMWGMGYALDVLFSDEQDRVVGLEAELRPWRISKHYRQATRVIELPVGTLEQSGTCLGDQLLFTVVAAP
jgi:uncharacterized membrane protein (UPF0127 family)